MVLLIDNYDSFTYNLSHYLQTLGADVRVVRNDAMTADGLFALGASAVVVSPGPSSPKTRVCASSSFRNSRGACRCSACASACSR